MLPLVDNIKNGLVFALVFVIAISLLKVAYHVIQEKRFLKNLSKSGIYTIDKMDGFQFETYLKSLFKKLGYSPSVTKKTGDFGADLILKGKNKIVIQAKRYNYKNKVSIKAIQEIFTAKTYYAASESWVVTNSTFTKKAKELAKVCNVKLIDRTELVNLINEINPEITPNYVYNNTEPKNRKCPICKSDLVLRTSKEDKFFGCSSYPTCKHTESVNK